MKDNRIELLDNLLKPCYREDAPGGAVLVSRQGKIEYEMYRGLADMADARRIGPNTPFCVASISKQFTAVGLLKLVERGLLSLDDSVAQHYPEL